VAKDGKELLHMIDGDEPPNLVVLDLDLPFAEGGGILEKLRRRAMPLPVVIHSFLTDTIGQLNGESSAAIVEKCENTDYLKAAVMDMLRKFYPHRFSSNAAPDRPENVGTSQP
jgi:DNA-binding response OmpR family regulator